MKTVQKIFGLFNNKRVNTTPILIIKKDSNNDRIKEYSSIEEALTDLENDPNIPSDKIEKIRTLLKQLKNKTSITIRNGELI